ncbi:MAG: SRPBCC family protein [Vampirovibrionales bacterium]
MIQQRFFSLVCGLVVSCLLAYTPLSFALPIPDTWQDFSSAEQTTLQKGHVVVHTAAPSKTNGGYHQVVASMLVKVAPKKVFEVLSNQPEAMKGAPGFKKVSTLDSSHQGLQQKINYKVVLGGIMPFEYTTLVKLNPYHGMNFQRVAGSFKDFKGACKLLPYQKGEQTIIVYQVNVIPDLPMPAFVTQTFLKKDIPNTLRHIGKVASN